MDIEKIIKSVPDIYKDGLKPAIQETGKVLAIIPQTVNAALLPLRKWNIEREYKFSEIEKLLYHKLENVEPEKIVTPETYVAIPAIQAISYSMDSAELRNLYANLLAKAMNIDTKETVHPSFVDIIKSMSPLDSLVFKYIMEHRSSSEIGYLQIQSREVESYAVKIIANYVTAIPFANYIDVECSINSLLRNLLIVIDDDFAYTDEAIYQEIEHTPSYINIKNSFEPQIAKLKPPAIFNVKKGSIKSTRLGKLFYKICVNE